MHTPNPGQSEPDVRDPKEDKPRPPVPPDQRDDVVPQEDPPGPGQRPDRPPLIVAGGAMHTRREMVPEAR